MADLLFLLLDPSAHPSVHPSVRPPVRPPAHPSTHPSGQGFISHIRFLSDTEVLTSSGDGEICKWDIASKKVVQRYQGHTKVGTSPGGPGMAGSRDI